jgi:signal transduction histidine kinase
MQLARLVDDLVDASRIVRGQVTIERQPTRLNDVIELAVNVVERAVAQHEQDLQVMIPTQEIWVDADPTRLQQVLSNLLTNAVKFTPDKGAIVLAVEPGPTTVTIRVRDTGCGISSKVLPHIFDLFAQEKHEGGLGIGLAVVRALVERHGGTVEARSDGAGCGSEFIVRIPVLAERGDT